MTPYPIASTAITIAAIANVFASVPLILITRSDKSIQIVYNYSDNRYNSVFPEQFLMKNVKNDAKTSANFVKKAFYLAKVAVSFVLKFKKSRLLSTVRVIQLVVSESMLGHR